MRACVNRSSCLLTGMVKYWRLFVVLKVWHIVSICPRKKRRKSKPTTTTTTGWNITRKKLLNTARCMGICIYSWHHCVFLITYYRILHEFSNGVMIFNDHKKKTELQKLSNLSQIRSGTLRDIFPYTVRTLLPIFTIYPFMSIQNTKYSKSLNITTAISTTCSGKPQSQTMVLRTKTGKKYVNR